MGTWILRASDCARTAPSRTISGSRVRRTASWRAAAKVRGEAPWQRTCAGPATNATRKNVCAGGRGCLFSGGAIQHGSRSPPYGNVYEGLLQRLNEDQPSLLRPTSDLSGSHPMSSQNHGFYDGPGGHVFVSRFWDGSPLLFQGNTFVGCE